MQRGELPHRPDSMHGVAGGRRAPCHRRGLGPHAAAPRLNTSAALGAKKAFKLSATFFIDHASAITSGLTLAVSRRSHGPPATLPTIRGVPASALNAAIAIGIVIFISQQI